MRTAGAVNGDDGAAQGRSDVERANVVGDDKVGEPKPFDHFGEESFAGKIEATVRLGTADGLGQWAVCADAKNGKVQVVLFGGEVADGFGEELDGPALSFPGRRRSVGAGTTRNPNSPGVREEPTY